MYYISIVFVRNVSESKLSNFFCKYRDPCTVGGSSSSSDEAITTEGVELLCRDLDLKPEEFRVLVLAWRCRAAQMCRLTRAEFSRGCRSLRADNPRSLHARLTEVAAETLATPEHFKDLYRFTYSFGLEPGQKVLPAEMACSLWNLVFNPARQPGGVPPLLDRWIKFVKEHPEQVERGRKYHCCRAVPMPLALLLLMLVLPLFRLLPRPLSLLLLRLL